MKPKLTLLIALLIGFVCQAQSIEKFSIDSGGASASAGDIQILYTIGEVFVAERSAATISVSEGFISATFKIQIDPKVFLQGPLLSPATAGLMNDNLREDNLLPTTSPYADNAVITSPVLSTTGNNAIVDWVWVELRAANDNTKIINAKSALVQRDGDIVDLDGVSNLVMNAAPTSYYVVVKHHNHLGAMSSATIALSEDTATVVDFTNSAFSTYDVNAQAALTSGDMALWAGNTNSDDRVRYQGSGNDTNFIKDQVLAHPDNSSGNLFFYYAYDNADVNLDGRIRYQGSDNDSNLIKDIILTHPENTPDPSNLFFFLEKIPNN